MLSEAIKLDASAAVHAVADEVIGFEMPGSGMENFTRKAAKMARAGIYDLRVHHDDVIWPLISHWGIFELEGLDASAELRRDELRTFLTDLDAQARRFEEKRARSLEREASQAE
jgi:acyl-[acyl-carrier-protein] desaturase